MNHVTTLFVVFLFSSVCIAEPTTKPATKPVEYRSINQILNTIPIADRPKDGKWTDIKREAANHVLADSVVGHSARLVIIVANVAHDKAEDEKDPNAIKVDADHEGKPEIVSGVFLGKNADAAIGLNVKDKAIIEGTVAVAGIGKYGWLRVELTDCHLAKSNSD